jgi:hypothetical protein
MLAVACGYVRSGSWDDDPGNWHKAFRSTKPDDVVVVHSRYWRNPHWSYEAGYTFELAPNAKLREQLFAQNRLVKLEGRAAAEAKELCFQECPAWFAPKSIENYDVWTYADEPNSNFRVLIDKTTGAMFLTDYQV